MPQLPHAHLAPLSGRRSSDGTAVSGVLLALRMDAFHAEVLRAFLPAAGTHLYRRGNQALARQDDAPRFGSWNYLQHPRAGKRYGVSIPAWHGELAIQRR